MTSIVAEAGKQAHSLVAGLLSKAEVKPGSEIQFTGVKENEPTATETFDLSGKNIIVGVPGAFTGTCSAQVPGYIKAYDDIKARGVKEVYVVSVNDVFAMKAWKENLAASGTGVRFIADDAGNFSSNHGLLFDATPLLGGPRSKRYVIIAQDGKVETLAVEPNPGELTVTDVKAILPQL